MDIRKIDQAAFFARAEELLKGTNVSRTQAGSMWNFAEVGSIFVTREDRDKRPDRWMLELHVKTQRAGWDSCGVEPPDEKAHEAVKKLSEREQLVIRKT